MTDPRDPGRPVEVPADGAVTLHGDLTVPEPARGVVLFAHGSGSSRLSPRNRLVARALSDAGIATLLLDLLDPDEERRDQRTAELRFDIPLLADRLAAAADWLATEPAVARLQLGLFGASTGAAAALITAAERPDRVRAVVSRGGRPDLAAGRLGQVQAPTLLLVGGHDPAVLDMNEQAATQLTGAPHQVEVVPGATHLFEEPGTLEQVAARATDWFADHLSDSDTGTRASG